MSRSLRSLFRLVVCGVLLVSGPGVAAAQVFVLADYAPFDPGNTWDRENTLNTVLQGITRRTVLQQTKNIGGTETRILENSRSGSRTFMTNDAAGLRQHGWFMPASGNGSDVTGTFAPPLVLAEAVVEAGDVFESAGNVLFRIRGYGTFTGSYTLRSTIFGIESVSVPYRTAPFQALRLDMTVEILASSPGHPSQLLSLAGTDWYGFGVGELRSIEEYDGEIAENNLVATNLPAPASSCNDGLDNDGDALIDYPNDPGCFYPDTGPEDPDCQDGEDNDGDGNIDFDGGLTALGYVAAPPDLECIEGWEPNEAEAAPTPTPMPLPVGDLPMCRSKRGNQMTVLVPPSNVQASMDKGLSMGECPDPMNGLVMCKAKRGKMTTMLIPHSKVQRSLDKGLALGVCRAP